MARSSKPAPFAIYEDVHPGAPQDSAIGIVDSERRLSKTGAEIDVVDSDVERLGNEVEEEDEQARTNHQASQSPDEDVETDGDADDERRTTMNSRTSISSVPESTWNTDAEATMPMHPPYTPPVVRPAFRRPESVRRMQMASPPPFQSRSPRRSVVRSSLSRNATPRSVRSATAKGRPLPKRVVSEESASEAETSKEYPLVLLHVTILPAVFPWSQESMQDLLPTTTRDNLELLRTKISETVLQRGILIPHPRHEYELLEERLLEALELRQERVTKCGHFRNRQSTSSESSAFSGKDSDSGVGSSIDGDSLFGDRCRTCRHHIKDARHGVDKKWSVEVYASNGLMRSSAWSAVWNDMERVDVQIMPYISEDIRKQLNERRDLETQEDEGIEVANDIASPVRTLAKPLDNSPLSFLYENAPVPATVQQKPKAGLASGGSTDEASALPKIYKQASDVPVTLLLKNYVCLLARDPTNIAIFFLVLGLIMIAIRPSAHSAQVLPAPQTSSGLDMAPSVVAPVQSQTNATTPFIGQTVAQIMQNDSLISPAVSSELKPRSPAPEIDSVLDDITDTPEQTALKLDTTDELA